MTHTDSGSAALLSLRDAAKALAQYLRQNSAMLTMPALNAIMAVEAAVEREKALPDVVADLAETAKRLRQDNAELTKQVAAERAEACRSVKAEAEMAELRRINAALQEQRDQFADAAGLGRKFAAERDLMMLVEISEQLKSAQKQCGIERTEAERLRADLDTARRHLQSVVHAADVALTYSGSPCDEARERLRTAAENARRVLNPGEPKAPATGGLADAPTSWLKAEVERLRKANRDLREQNWDLQVPDFPMLAEPPRHLHYAHIPGDWSSKSDEWFTYSRLMRNGHPTKMVRVGWRHGPGVSNSEVRDDDVKAALRGKEATMFTFNGTCSFKFPEAKVGIVRDPVTGWTFDKFRRELEAARTTAKGNAGLFADAMNQLAAAKGGA